MTREEARIVNITTRGKTREIVVPTYQQKRKCRKALPQLEKLERELARQLGVAEIAHGFVPGRSPVTAAQRHVGKQIVYTISCDLRNWFNSIHLPTALGWMTHCGLDYIIDPKIKAAIAEASQQYCIEGIPMQGLPTSPVLANIAGAMFDIQVKNALFDTTYTRYADDICLSVAEHLYHPRYIRDIIQAIAERCGWEIATEKTTIQYASAGRRTVLGISVGPHDIQPTRETRRKLRAARHQRPRSASTRGLSEWAKLREPGHGLDLRDFVKDTPQARLDRELEDGECRVF